MTRIDVLATVRAADPLDPAECDTWARSAGATALLERVVAAPLAPEPSHRRTRGRVIAGVALLAAGGTATATAFATGIIGGPAPDSVKQHLAGLDRGMPADLRYNPDVDHARGVAATASGALYLADTPDGGYCLEVVSDTDRPRGATCLTAPDVAGQPLEVTAPIPDNDASPLLVGGRANDPRIATLRATYDDGSTVDVPFGVDRAWLLEVATANRASALDNGLRIIGFDTAGNVVVTRTVPPLRDDDPLGTAHDAEQPIVVNTVSDGTDLTRVLAITGTVNIGGDARLTLHYPDGTTTPVAVRADGTFRVEVPASMQSAFADRPGQLVASRGGTVVATATVASVAWWRGHDG